MSIVSAMNESPDDELTRAPAATLTPTQWYCCETRIGELAVGIDAGAARLQQMQGPGLILQQAMLLSEVELTLQAFELWQGMDLDLVPSMSGSGQDELPDDKVELVITHESLPEYPPTRFRFNKQALPQIAAIDEQLPQALQLQWSPLAVTVTLDRLQLDAAAIDKISVGATVLLPASFQVPWQIGVSVPGINGMTLSATLDPRQKKMTLEPVESPESEEPQLVQCCVRLEHELSVSAALTLGDVSGSVIEVSSGSNALAALLVIEENPLALGAIGEVGRGYALHVTHMLTED